MRLAGWIAAIALTGAAGAQPVASPPNDVRWLYASSEAVAIERMTFRAAVAYALDMQTRRAFHEPIESAVLLEGAALDDPHWTACRDDQKGAVVFDIDETLLLNSGWNQDNALRGEPPFEPDRWAVWEATGAGKVQATPGAKEAIDALRAAGIVPIFISNRDRAYKGKNLEKQTLEALKNAGLGDAVSGDTLLLGGDVAPGSDKDPRRDQVAAHYCVLAMVGDQLGDFNNGFNPKTPPNTDPDIAKRRALADVAALRLRIGRGWFLLPNPLYGPGVAGRYDQLFDPKMKWPEIPIPEKK